MNTEWHNLHVISHIFFQDFLSDNYVLCSFIHSVFTRSLLWASHRAGWWKWRVSLVVAFVHLELGSRAAVQGCRDLPNLTKRTMRAGLSQSGGEGANQTACFTLLTNLCESGKRVSRPKAFGCQDHGDSSPCGQGINKHVVLLDSCHLLDSDWGTIIWFWRLR